MSDGSRHWREAMSSTLRFKSWSHRARKLAVLRGFGVVTVLLVAQCVRLTSRILLQARQLVLQMAAMSDEVEQMGGRRRRTAMLRVRVSEDVKRAVDEVATARDLDPSDIVREAVNRLLAKQTTPQPQPEVAS